MSSGRRFSQYVNEVIARLSVGGTGLTVRLDLMERLGLPRSEIEEDIADLLDQRIFLWLLGDIRPDLNYAERRRFTEHRLRKLLDEETLADRAAMDVLVGKLAECAAYISLATSSPREGVGSVEESSLRELLMLQGHRCAVCGVPLLASKRLATSWFKDGYEPLAEPHLDHVIPDYFLGNSANTEVLCANCNMLKSDRIGVHEEGPVVAANHV